jgi:hypothetical protein
LLLTLANPTTITPIVAVFGALASRAVPPPQAVAALG